MICPVICYRLPPSHIMSTALFVTAAYSSNNSNISNDEDVLLCNAQKVGCNATNLRRNSDAVSSKKACPFEYLLHSVVQHIAMKTIVADAKNRDDDDDNNIGVQDVKRPLAVVIADSALLTQTDVCIDISSSFACGRQSVQTDASPDSERSVRVTAAFSTRPLTISTAARRIRHLSDKQSV